MAKMNIKRMTECAEECLGWPYESPGNNDASGIDCSGLFVRMYKDQGKSIYHGSNTIYRKYCGEKGPLTSEKQLCEGMAVFKWNPKTPEKFNDGLGDFQHIGYVAGVNPLRIIHASSDAGCVTTDTKIGKWKYWGKLDDVDYSGGGKDSKTEQDEKQEESEVYTAILAGGNVKKPINVRKEKDGDLLDTLPQGSKVTVIGEEGDWCKIRFGKKTGWVKGEFVSVADDDDEGGGPSADEPIADDSQIPAEDFGDDDGDEWGKEEVSITLTMTTAQAAYAVPVLQKLVDAIVDKVGRG